MKASLHLLLEAAVRAPSGDNMQPWRFEIDNQAGTITIYVDETRDRSPMNAKQLMARVAIGAAVENVCRTAAKNGWSALFEPAPAPAVARLRFADPPETGGDIDEVITARVTNRRFYDGRPVPKDVLARLAEATPSLEGITTYWITARDRLNSIADLIGRADALMFSERSMRAAFLANIRFDQAPDAEVDFGLPLAALEVSRNQRIALRLLPLVPNQLVKLSAQSIFGAHARKLVQSAGGLCLIVATDHAEQTYFLVGRALQRAWLALSEAGLAVQPMMSLVVLETTTCHGSPEILESLGQDRLAVLAEEFRRLAPEIGDGYPAFLLRFGFGANPSGRTGRLTWQASLSDRNSHSNS